MSQPYVGECRLVGFSFQVNGWNYCNGATISIAQNDTLFALIGTTYGGDGQQTFQLPDLRGRVPIHQGPGFVIGQRSGLESVTLTSNQMPQHNHQALASGVAGSSNLVAGNLPASNSHTPCYVSPASADSGFSASMVGSAGGNQPHENMQPYLVMNWIISLYGVFPSQN